MKKSKVNLKRFLKEREEELCLDRVDHLPDTYRCEICLPLSVHVLKGNKIVVRGENSPVAAISGTALEQLLNLSAEKQKKFFSRLKRKGALVVIVCRPHRGEPEKKFAEIAAEYGVLTLSSRLSFQDFVHAFTDNVIDSQAKAITIHGVLLDILGVGVLLQGPSGIGKSEVALELITRGARLVSDDAIEVVSREEESLYGMSPSITRYHMEIRGLGIINIRDLFGVASVRQRKKIELVVEMIPWDRYEGEETAWKEEVTDLLGVKVPLIRLPVAPGRNMATLIEIAARNYLLKKTGIYSSEDFERRLSKKIQYKTGGKGKKSEENYGSS